MTPPSIPGLVTPIYSLAAFSVVNVGPAGDTTTSVTLGLPPSAFLTTAADGSRAVTPGIYTIAVSGHTPGDALGIARASNVVQVRGVGSAAPATVKVSCRTSVLAGDRLTAIAA